MAEGKCVFPSSLDFLRRNLAEMYPASLHSFKPLGQLVSPGRNHLPVCVVRAASLLWVNLPHGRPALIHVAEKRGWVNLLSSGLH